MPASSRLSDMWTGVCLCHTGPIPMVGIIITGSPNDKSGGLSQARLTDITLGNCGHTGLVVSGSPNCKANSLGKVRIGDTVSGCNVGTVITGSPTHNVN